jgi:YetA-like protein
MSDYYSRRRFIAAGALGTAVLPLGMVSSEAMAAGVRPVPSPMAPPDPAAGTWTRWLDDRAPVIFGGATWGVPWARGKHSAKTQFALRDVAGAAHPLQSWPLAFWPDGSLKWTAHAVAANLKLGDGPFRLDTDAAKVVPAQVLTLKESATGIDIDTGIMRCRLARSGQYLINSLFRGDREVLRNGYLVLLSQDRPTPSDTATVAHEAFASVIDNVVVEQRGPVRAVVKIVGMHAGVGGRSWLPFTVRLYFYAGGDSMRVLHTIIFDGDESRDFIRGIGLRFSAPQSDELYDRHIRFAGSQGGVFGEAVQGLTGLRRDAGNRARSAQIDGIAATGISDVVKPLLTHVPKFSDWSLLQTTAESFLIRKRTAEGHGWLDSDRGRRAAGLGYVGGPSGGIAFGIRNFWQSYPAQLDIRHASGTAAEVTLWVWAPDAPPMDLRFYHDGMGQDTYESQRQGLEITYEDYEPGFGTPVGVARTSEMTLWALPATPNRDRFAQMGAALNAPALLVASPQTLHEAGVFGHTFSLPDRSVPENADIEDKLAWLFDFYHEQQDQRGWYGFWNYGDVMHTYDADRHVWRYDIGGFAWDNSELGTDLWLWLYFLRTGRADVFRFTEALTRHTGEVDVYHSGRFAPLGSRHNVMHWGCSAKQLRISTALNRRYYYFLTGDERVGDLMHEQVEAARTLRRIQPGRKLPEQSGRQPVDPDGIYAYLGFGTDWGSLASAWLTEWERSGDPHSRERLIASMRSIGAQPHGFFSSGSRMNLVTGAFDIMADTKAQAGHLSAAFGLPEVCAELIDLLHVPEFETAWLQYCRLYDATPEEQRAELGESLRGLILQQGHSRLTAYAAHRSNDPKLAARAWKELRGGQAGDLHEDQKFISQSIGSPAVLNSVDEAAWLSTNLGAQWGLAAIVCLAFAPR